MWIELLKEFLGKKAGERIFLDQGEAKALVAAGIAREVSDDPLSGVIAKGVESALAGFTRGLDGIINATLKQFAQVQSMSRKNAVPILFGQDGAGDPKKSFGDWCLAVARKDTGYLEKHYGSVFNAWRNQGGAGGGERRRPAAIPCRRSSTSSS